MRRLILSVMLGGALLVAAGVSWMLLRSRGGATLPVVEVPFLNTAVGVAYVGSQACRECHATEAETYHHTGMARSMAAIDLANEPPDGTFEHAKSQRRYQVLRRDGRLWHRELSLSAGADEVVWSEYPVAYVVGSGRHSRSYLIEADGFLIESPITWYAALRAWGMSPGYDRADHPGFEREAGEGCLTCHAGQSRALDRSLHRMQIDEAAIGCERCHGPGSLHVAAHRTETPSANYHERVRRVDRTIVNPVHLSRERSEAICQQCHLRSEATVVAPGRAIDDFRPGLPLEQFVHNYRLNVPDAQMTVVGHVEQLHFSRCYTASGTLTCLTCHDPHAGPTTTDSVATRTAQCRVCHQPSACRVD
ncbi:MAG: hypothetical protein B7Z55_13900, partial [Planctomycetales bacterium 12-60-4]